MFTKQERLVIVVLSLVLFCGSSLSLAFKKYPNLLNMVNFIESDQSYYKINVNHSSPEELDRVPFIGKYTALNIIAYRNKHGNFRSLEDIKKVNGIYESNFEKFRKYLKL